MLVFIRLFLPRSVYLNILSSSETTQYRTGARNPFNSSQVLQENFRALTPPDLLFWNRGDVQENVAPMLFHGFFPSCFFAKVGFKSALRTSDTQESLFSAPHFFSSLQRNISSQNPFFWLTDFFGHRFLPQDLFDSWISSGKKNNN